MKVTTKQLRIEPGRIVTQAANGQEITITYRGKPCAKIVPIVNRKNLILEEPEEEYLVQANTRHSRASDNRIRRDSPDELFGLWKTRKDTKNVEQFVRNLRKGRKL